jgi:hypothetical protein
MRPHDSRTALSVVIAELDPAIHLFLKKKLSVLMDARVKPGHSGDETHQAATTSCAGAS